MEIPPGFVYLFQSLPVLIIPSSLYLFSAVLQTHLQISFPTWAIVLLSPPVTFLLKVAYRDYTDQRDAALNNAFLPPQVKDKSFGGLGLLSILNDGSKNGYPGEALHEWCQIYGNTINTKILFKNRIFTTEPEYIKLMLATQFDSFDKVGRGSPEKLDSLLGTGVFNSDGDMWKFHRGMTRPFFSKERIADFDIFGRHADDAISQLKTRLEEGYPVDFQDMVARFTLDSASEFLFGNDVCSLSAGLPYPYSASLPSATPTRPATHPANTFVHAFAEAQRLAVLRDRLDDHWRLGEFWADRMKKEAAVMRKFIDPIVAIAIAKKRATTNLIGEIEGEDEETLLSHLVNHTEDHATLRDEILNIIVAGRDTTATTLTFAVYLLAEHPSVLQQLRKEILDNIGSSRYPTYDDLRQMKYLRAVINETLRLYPAVAINARSSNKATIWSSKKPGVKSLYIPAGSRCIYSAFYMHRRTDLWGPDAEKFDPDRFIDERLGKYLTPNPFIFLPFNAGPRICLGQQFAYNEISFFLIRLLQSMATIKLASDAQPPESRPPANWANASGTKATEKIWPRSHLTLYVEGGLWVQMEKATETD